MCGFTILIQILHTHVGRDKKKLLYYQRFLCVHPQTKEKKTNKYLTGQSVG